MEVAGVDLPKGRVYASDLKAWHILVEDSFLELGYFQTVLKECSSGHGCLSKNGLQFRDEAKFCTERL